jgi:ATP-dependent DNA helicase RecG
MPQFEEKRGSFIVTLFGERKQPVTKAIDDGDILSFCSTPRTRQEIADFLGVKICSICNENLYRTSYNSEQN